MSWLAKNRLSAKQSLVSHSNDQNNNSIVNKSFAVPTAKASNSATKLEKVSNRTSQAHLVSSATILKNRDDFKLPTLHRRSVSITNPEEFEKQFSSIRDQIYYQSHILYSLNKSDSTYMVCLAKQHFLQTIQTLRITANQTIAPSKKTIKLEKQCKFKKTVFLDMDETLVHTDEKSDNYTVKLSFPINSKECIQAGVRIRPHCKEFLEQMSKMAEIIIFTASNSPYATVILDYLDPDNKYFAHRLFRQHCTLYDGYYTKDLRTVNRNIKDSVLVDNSAVCYMLHPENGIPILPFYHFQKDTQLLKLLGFLHEIVQTEDSRQVINRTFFWKDYFIKQHSYPRKILEGKMRKIMAQKQSVRNY